MQNGTATLERTVMMDIIFATNNFHKLHEISSMLGQQFRLFGLKDLNIIEDIPEDFDTLEENASQKAWYIFNKYGKSCFADDTGLEVDALGGEPGVYSARYSRMGFPLYPDRDVTEANMRKLLEKLKGSENRQAQFRTVIALVLGGEEFRFEGKVRGSITEVTKGTEGFGYDPVFKPDGFEMTFAQMGLSMKNSISHRAKAVERLINFLQEL